MAWVALVCIAAPMRKMTENPMSEYFRPNLSLQIAAAIAPKKHPAVRRETTFEETFAFLALAKPVLPGGRPKSSLKLESARTLPITPVSNPWMESAK
jgi:hypothetical protein